MNKLSVITSPHPRSEAGQALKRGPFSPHHAPRTINSDLLNTIYGYLLQIKIYN